MSLARYRISACILLVLGGSTAYAQSDKRTSPYIEALGNCRSITTAAERADCYDRAYDALTAARARKEVVVMDREDVRETRKGLFGFGNIRLPFLSGGGDDDPEVPKTLAGTIKSYSSLGYGRYTITLEDGAVWETTETSSNFYPKNGQKVEVSRGALTNYFIKIEQTGRRARARRVR